MITYCININTLCSSCEYSNNGIDCCHNPISRKDRVVVDYLSFRCLVSYLNTVNYPKVCLVFIYRKSLFETCMSFGVEMVNKSLVIFNRETGVPSVCVEDEIAIGGYLSLTEFKMLVASTLYIFGSDEGVIGG